MSIFVFGSNLAGRHGKGAALTARIQHGAINGFGIGRVGNSYAIPTKDERIRTLSLERIHQYVHQFITYASTHPELEFNVTAIGCGLAGYQPSDIAPMFKSAPPNCSLPESFKSVLGLS